MAEELLDRSTLGQSDKEAIESILRKSPTALTDGEIGALRARRCYLTPVESATFESVLVVVPEKVAYADMKNADLIALLNEREIEIPDTAKVKADYVALLEAADEAEKVA